MAEYITEATENLVKDNLPAYYKYRYTFSKAEQDLQEQQNILKEFSKYIKENYALDSRITGGIEHYTKGMVATKPHMHIHFVSKHKSDTIRKGIMRRFDLIGRCQSCKPEVIVDEDKFWRYPLKQQAGDTYKGNYHSGFTKEVATNMRDVAYACWKQAAEIAVGKIEKKLERTSKERLFAYLDTLEMVTEKEAVVNALEYYVEHEETFCAKTIQGYVHCWMLKNNKISYDEFYNRHLKF